MRLSVVIVHFHAARWAARAVDAVRADLAASGLDAEILVVDNGSSADDRAILSGLDVHLLSPGRNLGYAGGVNLGADRADGDMFVFMNPDVEVAPGCLGTLAGVLGGGVAAAGPRFYWDRARRLMLPPTEQFNRTREFGRRMATRGGGWVTRARQRWRQHARRHWDAEHPLESPSLSGALLTVRRDAWSRTGPFDTGYDLYYEESDWLARLWRAGLRSQYIPAAQAYHAFNQSAQHEASAPAWMHASAMRFARRHYGAWFNALTERAGVAPGRVPLPEPPALPAGAPQVQLPGRGPERLWIEVSPALSGFPAAAERVADGQTAWELPEEVWQHLAPGRYYVQVVDDASREWLRVSWRKPEAAAP